MGVAIWWMARHPSVRRGRLLYVLMALYLLFSGAYAVAHRLTGKGIDVSVIYHLQTGLGGTGWLDFAPVLAGAAVGIFLSLVLPACLIRRLQGQALQPSPSGAARPLLMSLALMGTAWAAHPGVHDLRQLGAAFLGPTSASADTFFTPPLSLEGVQTVGPARDLVWIYLESLERGYLDSQRFPGLTPNLTALEQQSLSFTNLKQVEGTGWTIAGMVASQCGVPLLSLADGHALTGADRFMSNATCFGDLLKNQGHHLQFLGGASLVFAGKGAFYRTHGFEPQGLDEITPLLPKGTPVTDWGLYDDTLYAHAWQQLTQQAQQEAPLGMLMLTLDTHHPKGHPSVACKKMPYGDARNPMLNAVHCADMLVGRFVRQLQQHPRLKDALVVISSDHLAMPNTATEQLEKEPRRNLLLMLNSGLPAQQIDRPSTSLDTAPTVLHLMGLQVPAMGYGRDLLAADPTLAEAMTDNTDAFLLGRIPVLRQLWRYPDLRQGLQWQADHLLVDRRRLPLPLLFQIDDKDRVSGVAYPGGRSLAELVLELPESQSILWIDQCALLQGLNGQEATTGGYCMAIGKAGRRWQISPIEPHQAMDHQAIRQIMTHSRLQAAEPVLHEARPRLVQNWVQWGSLNIDQVLRVKGLQQPLVLRSSGHPSATSVANVQTSTDFLLRGLTLVRIKPDGQVEKVAHKDTCAQQPAEAVGQAHVQAMDRLARLKPQAGQAVLALMAHDSAVCGVSSLPDVVKDTPLQVAAQIGFRQPYIGIWLPDGSVHEYTSSNGQTLTLVLTPEDGADLAQAPGIEP
jgi:phosphoglycerol transferase